MDNKPNPFEIPEDIQIKWQEVTDALSDLIQVPAALITRYTAPHLEVYVTSRSDGNPFTMGEKDVVQDSGIYCEKVMDTQKQLLVSDALADEAWKDNPEVELGMISYLGFPVMLPNGNPFGTLCVMDSKPNGYSGSVEKLMLHMRNLLESHLELLFMNLELGEENRRVSDYLNELKVLRGYVPICANCKSIRDSENHWHSIENYLNTQPDTNFSHGLCPSCETLLYP